MNRMYLSMPLVNCFDGDDDAATKAAADAAANDNAGKTFTQDDVNRMLADDKRKHQAALLKTEQTYKDLLASNKSLTEKERSTLEENLLTVQGQLRTKEEQAKMEKKQLEEQLTRERESGAAKAAEWEKRYRDETITRNLLDAAGTDAFQPSQIKTILHPMTRLVEETDEKTGKSTGRFRTVVDFPDVDAEGQPTITVRTPAEAVKRMKELPEQYGNLFRSNVVSGIGSNSATGVTPGANGKVDLKKLASNPEQFRKVLKENPELLGLSRKAGSRR